MNKINKNKLSQIVGGIHRKPRHEPIYPEPDPNTPPHVEVGNN